MLKIHRAIYLVDEEKRTHHFLKRNPDWKKLDPDENTANKRQINGFTRILRYGRKNTSHFLPILWIILLLATSCTWKSQQYYGNGVPDEEYVSMARLHPDAQAFLEKYPQAEILVDRSGRLAVDFRVTRRPLTSTTQLWEGIRLRVFIDPKTNQPIEAFIQCDNQMIKDNLQKYLEQYFTTQICP